MRAPKHAASIPDLSSGAIGVLPPRIITERGQVTDRRSKIILGVDERSGVLPDSADQDLRSFRGDIIHTGESSCHRSRLLPI